MLWNKIWNDMMIDETYMQHEKASDGMIGVTTKLESV